MAALSVYKYITSAYLFRFPALNVRNSLLRLHDQDFPREGTAIIYV